MILYVEFIGFFLFVIVRCSHFVKLSFISHVVGPLSSDVQVFLQSNNIFCTVNLSIQNYIIGIESDFRGNITRIMLIILPIMLCCTAQIFTYYDVQYLPIMLKLCPIIYASVLMLC